MRQLIQECSVILGEEWGKAVHLMTSYIHVTASQLYIRSFFFALLSCGMPKVTAVWQSDWAWHYWHCWLYGSDAKWKCTTPLNENIQLHHVYSTFLVGYPLDRMISVLEEDIGSICSYLNVNERLYVELYWQNYLTVKACCFLTSFVWIPGFSWEWGLSCRATTHCNN